MIQLELEQTMVYSWVNSANNTTKILTLWIWEKMINTYLHKVQELELLILVLSLGWRQISTNHKNLETEMQVYLHQAIKICLKTLIEVKINHWHLHHLIIQTSIAFTEDTTSTQLQWKTWTPLTKAKRWPKLLSNIKAIQEDNRLCIKVKTHSQHTQQKICTTRQLTLHWIKVLRDHWFKMVNL